ncbi:hypothetical protein ABIE32_003859 [Comamonas sp. 4034]
MTIDPKHPGQPPIQDPPPQPVPPPVPVPGVPEPIAD